MGALRRLLDRALAPVALPASAHAGGFLREGFDAARREAAEGEAAGAELARRWAADSGEKGLRVRRNNAVGWHAEVPAAQAALAAKLPGFAVRQGLAGATRFSAPELDALAARLGAAGERARAAERRAFEDLRARAVALRGPALRAAGAAAALDLVCGLAQAAAEGLWAEPEVDDGPLLEIEAGRHPVAERLLEARGVAFQPNDCRLAAGGGGGGGGGGEAGAPRMWLLTGPNMAGKSTLLRQTAVIVLLAQIGSFVPARRARIGVVDRVFSRVGAGDDLAAGRSTFLVEMLETAAILRGATARSLVILDEVGRGTSTEDGLAIAQAAMEHLHGVGCRALFSTHLHELCDVADALGPGAACMAMAAEAGERGEAFAHRVAPGRAGRSHGLRVAATAGLPEPVLRRAGEIFAARTGGPSGEGVAGFRPAAPASTLAAPTVRPGVR